MKYQVFKEEIKERYESFVNENGFYELVTNPQFNLTSKRRYKGNNHLSLVLSAIEKGFTSNQWGTVNQINKLGGKVKKGEKGTKIFFFKVKEKETTEMEWKTSDLLKVTTTREEIGRIGRSFTVFNLEQTTLEAQSNIEQYEVSFESILDACSATISVQDLKEEEPACLGFYRSWNHSVYVRPQEYIKEYYSKNNDFTNEEHLKLWKQVLLHEIVHSTQKDLNRDLDYDMEEIVAEIGSLLLASASGQLFPVMEKKCYFYTHHYSNMFTDKIEAFRLAEKAADFLIKKAERKKKEAA